MPRIIKQFPVSLHLLSTQELLLIDSNCFCRTGRDCEADSLDTSSLIPVGPRPISTIEVSYAPAAVKLEEWGHQLYKMESENELDFYSACSDEVVSLASSSSSSSSLNEFLDSDTIACLSFMNEQADEEGVLEIAKTESLIRRSHSLLNGEHVVALPSTVDPASREERHEKKTNTISLNEYMTAFADVQEGEDDDDDDISKITGEMFVSVVELFGRKGFFFKFLRLLYRIARFARRHLPMRSRTTEEVWCGIL